MIKRINVTSGTHYGEIQTLRSGNRINLFQNSHTSATESQDVLSLAPEQALKLAAALIQLAEPDREEVTNAARAGWAATAVMAYGASHKGDDDPQTAFGDLLCDLWHYADQIGIDFGLAADMAERHHEEEVELEKAYGPGASG